jgi:hypothetical protein
MKSVRLLGLSLLALLALGAFAAATASAEEGFLPKLASANLLGGTSILLGIGGSEIKCTKLDASTITFTTDEHGTATLKWTGCKAANLFAANSLGDAKEVILAKVLFLVCLDPTNLAGKLLEPFGFAAETDEPVHLEEPAVGQLQVVTGRVIGTFLTAEGKLFVAHLNAPKTVPEADLCIKGTETKKHTLTVEENHNGKPEFATEEVLSALIQFAETVKLMDS